MHLTLIYCQSLSGIYHGDNPGAGLISNLYPGGQRYDARATVLLHY